MQPIISSGSVYAPRSYVSRPQQIYGTPTYTTQSGASATPTYTTQSGAPTYTSQSRVVSRGYGQPVSNVVGSISSVGAVRAVSGPLVGGQPQQIGTSMGSRIVSAGPSKGQAPAAWKELAEKESKDKTGWMVWNDRVLLRQASKKYGKAITLPQGAQVPFNETADWYGTGGQDHWFELPLNTNDVVEEVGEFITGRLFTTRMPRALEQQDDADATDIRMFKHKVQCNNLQHVFVLVEDEEPAKGKSSNLFQFYQEECGLQVHHKAIEDYNVPAFEVENSHIEELCIALSSGENCLVHCWGGSGRTGTVIIGALQNLGFNQPIKFARRIKSVYLDIAEQEDFLAHQHLIITERMAQQCPEMTLNVVLEHLEDLSSGASFVESSSASTDSEVKALEMVFGLACHHSTGRVSLQDLVALSKFVGPKTINTRKLADAVVTADPSLGPSSRIADDHEILSFENFQKLMSLNANHFQGNAPMAKPRAAVLG